MSNHSLNSNHHFSDIPQIFHTYEKGEHFKKCITCDVDLISSGELYIIEKVIKQYTDTQTKDVIFEYAMCFNCVLKMKEAFSMVSLQRIQEYMLRHTKWIIKRNEMIKNEELDVDDWLAHCIINGTSIKELSEFQIACQCIGDKMVYSHLPYMISFEATEEISMMLSAQTKDEIDRFYKEFLGVPPDLQEFFNKPKLLLI